MFKILLHFYLLMCKHCNAKFFASFTIKIYILNLDEAILAGFEVNFMENDALLQVMYIYCILQLFCFDLRH